MTSSLSARVLRLAVFAIIVCAAVVGSTGTAFAGFSSCSHTISIVVPNGGYQVQEGQTVTVTVNDHQSTTYGQCAQATVDYATSDGTGKSPADYSSRTGTLTFTGTASSDGRAPGTADVTQTFTVPTVDNGRREGDLNFTVSLRNVGPTCCDAVATGAPSMASITIHDVDVPPAATTGAAGSVTTAGATLTGTVNPNNLATTYHFEYGTTTEYGTSIPSPDASAGSGSSDVSESASLSGLTPGTTYHYRMVATSSAGTTNGADQIFTTSTPAPAPAPAPSPAPAAVAPLATTLAATAVTTSSGTVHGTVNPQGSVTTYHFDYGTSIAYGQSTQDSTADAGSADVPVSAALSGFAPGTTVHYRVVAVSAGGTTTGGDLTFTTTPLPPTAAIVTPKNGSHFAQGSTQSTRFGCIEGRGGPGLSSCADSNGASTTTLTGSGQLATATLGEHTYTVTATSRDGQRSVATISYVVVRAPLVAAHLQVRPIVGVRTPRGRCQTEVNYAATARVRPAQCTSGALVFRGNVNPRADGQRVLLVLRAHFSAHTYTVRISTRVHGGRYAFAVRLPGRTTDFLPGHRVGSGGDRWDYTISMPSSKAVQSAERSGHFTFEVEPRGT